ncbi:MAG: RNA polymerase sigma factor SigM [Candidatus Nanopelagicales bacterium]|jgi:RNA polymerase sigma-70 factor (ECF subfamily)
MEQVGAPSDAELLSLHVGGDPLAFSVIVERHRDRLWAVALRTTGDPEDAADALQDALISAFKRASQFRGESAVTTWLHRIVVNASLDRLRRRAVRSTVPLPDDDTKAGRALIDPTDLLGQREDQIAIASALAALPVDQRDAILLVDVEGWSVEEAAAMLDCPPGTIKSRCSRGRAKLAVALAHLRNSPRAGNQDVVPPVLPPRGDGTRG